MEAKYTAFFVRRVNGGVVPGAVSVHSDNVLIKVTNGPSKEKNADSATCSVLVLVDLSLLLAVK